ncbi:hypothetical protein [Bradyrhizobium phage ppBeUSDA76-2]|uniref:hypothetical protein n=1 Tax=Bradyrhizobium elkanii TaxID=29448 RepID=UPI00036E378A|nr:hypothetical protein [Bradyrhizobium elkanii]WAX24440.1 hypothetical protein [Bradyrhizobium phage ppBeUSDA76-2]MCP1732398.1 hypothetical protein [Bradyrhizobium elkanii]MCS3567736.1 hypothetical protein [Bradyrhizobium elkanii]MCS3590781.1 hypothetical protein [Bradyrhizobium elkanii]MCS3620224.1 hypothetical protein [Bradyrhizobium elkanii]
MTPIEKRKQAADQCRVVAHLATAIAQIHSDKGRWLSAPRIGESDSYIELVGKRSAELMETLGNILNGMDGVEDEDEWVNPIFDRAKEVWPIPNGRL